MGDLDLHGTPARVAGQPRTLIGTWPTPVHRLDAVSGELGLDVWAKREDLCGAWGGNKVRKLEFWLARAAALQVPRVVVSGAGASTWAAAAALLARRHDIEVVVGLAGDIPEDKRRLYDELDVHVIHHASLNALPFVVARAKLSAGRRSLLLPMGGSGWPGDLGPFLAGIEIAEGALRRSHPRPQAIFVAAGTSGTAGGVAAGLSHRGERISVVAVRVTPRPLGTKLQVWGRARKLLRKVGRAPDQTPLTIVGENRFFGDGYGRPGPGVDEAIEMASRDGLALEPTYTGKAFAALMAHAREKGEGPLLFLHTATSPTPPSGS
jgi:D-cysteine desulfhydrase